MTTKNKQYFGNKFYSPFLGCECIVVEVLNNDKWYFIAAKSPRKILKAGSPLDYFFAAPGKLRPLK